MGSGLSATDKIGKLEIIERQSNALLVLVFSWELLTIAETWNDTGFMLSLVFLK